MSLPAQALKRDVKSRLLPLSPLESLFERLLECLPRTWFSVDLAPHEGVDIVDPARGSFRASTGRPRLAISFNQKQYKPGWYYLEAALTRHTGSRQAWIEYELNASVCQIPVPSNLRGSVREVLHLPAGASHFCWVATGAPGFFSQSPLLFHRISALESWLRRFHRVMFDRSRLSRLAHAAVAEFAFGAVLFRLSRAYARSAELRMNRLAATSYANYLEAKAVQDKAYLARMPEMIARMPQKPQFTFLLSVDACTSANGLAATLESLQAQSYVHWRCIVCSSQPLGDSVLQAIHAFTKKDARFLQLVPQESMPAALNHALTLLPGAWFCRLDAGGVLTRDALYSIVGCLSEHADAALIYADHDYMDEFGCRTAPHFKPAWNPDLLHACDYIARPVFMRTEVVLSLGGYRDGLQGAEDYDLLLRMGSALAPQRIHHVARVLYHQLDLAIHPADAPWLTSAPEQALAVLNQHLSTQGAFAQSLDPAGLFRPVYPLPPQPPRVSILIPTRDRAEILKTCISSILTLSTYPDFEIIVVDNGSVEPSAIAYLEELRSLGPKVKVLSAPGGFNYSRLNNQALQEASGTVLALLNNDIEVITPGWLEEMVAHAIRPGIGAVGAKLLYPNGIVQHAGVVTGIGGVAGHVHKYLAADAPGYCHRACLTQNFSAVTGACLVLRRDAYEQAGMLDETLAVAFNDIDLCLKLAEAGYRNLFTPFARLYHHESLSRGADDTSEKQEVFRREFSLMQKRWGGKLSADPAYHPELTLEFENFGFRSYA